MKIKKCMSRFWNAPREFYLRIAFVLKIGWIYVEYLPLWFGEEGYRYSLKIKKLLTLCCISMIYNT